jgi:uncharacterized protein YcbK (DUF882 family)
MSLWDDLGDVVRASMKFMRISVSLRFSQTGFTQKKESKMPPNWKYFKPEEVPNLDPEFVSKLDLATAQTADIDKNGKRFPFVITSGFRSVQEEQSLPGGVCASAHTKGLAVDLRVSDGHEAFLVIASAVTVGISRWGIYTNPNDGLTHIHLDVLVDDLHPEQDMWIRREGAPYNSAPKTA